MEFPLLVAILSLSFLAGFWLFVLFWFVLPMIGLLTGLCVGPLPALLRLPTNLTALQANYNSAFLLRLNVCNDLAKAKALDGKKILFADLDEGTVSINCKSLIRMFSRMVSDAKVSCGSAICLLP